MQADFSQPSRRRSLAEIMQWPAGRARAFNVVMFMSLGIIPIVWLDRLWCPTTLITPVSPILRIICLVIGCAVSLTLASLMAVLVWFQPGPKGHGIGRTLATFLMFALILTPFYALISGRIAWRITEITTFAGVTAPMVPVLYREQGYRQSSRSAGSYYVEIDPFHTGNTTDVPIPGIDYRRLVSADRQDLAHGFCAKVLEQRAGNAVRIRIDAVHDNTPSQLVWCPGHIFGDQ